MITFVVWFLVFWRVKIEKELQKIKQIKAINFLET